MNRVLPRRTLASVVAGLCTAFVLSFQASGQESPKVERAKQVMRKAQAGEALTPDEQTFLDRVRADIKRRRGQSGVNTPTAWSSEGGAALSDNWEELSDGSLGQETEFQGVGGIAIPAYVRKPKGDGPFPVIVLLHGGRYGKAATTGLGRSAQSPVGGFLQAGWAIYSIDYRPSDELAIVPIEFDDSVEAVKAARKLPFVDPNRVGLVGGSHGAQVSSRVVSRVDVSGAVLCAPAAIDLIEVKKAAERGEPVVPILNKMIADMETKHGAQAEEIEKNPAKYDYSSALTEVAEVRAPLLIVNGRNDDNSPTTVIDAYMTKLRAAGKQVDTYLPENGPHGFYFGHPDIPETKEAAQQMVAFLQERFAQVAGAAPQSASTAPGKNTPARYDYGSMEWVDPDSSEPDGMKYQTFLSETIRQNVSYLVYLPPDYDEDETARYPVLYYLPASGGTPKSGSEIARRVDMAIRAGRVLPMIIVSVNGLRGNTMYCDSRDGLYPVETVLIKDLIPYVDATYRTEASRERRAVEGFSMGGFGAAHLGFKYPEVFGVNSIQAPALLGPDLQQPRPSQAWSRLFPNAMGGDLEYWQANDPFLLVPKNADALRDRTLIRIVCHIEDDNWLAPQCERLHQVLMQNNIPHEFCYFSNVKSHNRAQVLDTLGDSAFDYFSSSLPQP
jgi:endo-1,4-beta-xylanase